MSRPLSSSDPCYWMLQKGRAEEAKHGKGKYEWRSKPDESIYKDDCYICNDPEFSLMGMPLCYPCKFCGGHVAADDTKCNDCGREQEQDYNYE